MGPVWRDVTLAGDGDILLEELIHFNKRNQYLFEFIVLNLKIDKMMDDYEKYKYKYLLFLLKHKSFNIWNRSSQHSVFHEDHTPIYNVRILSSVNRFS